MKTMKWLLKRELWEHRGMLVFFPATVAGLLVIMVTGLFFKGQSATFQFGGETRELSRMKVELGGSHLQALVETVTAVYPLLAAPLYGTMAFMVFFYSMNALYDERRDRSILFWKSLPVSDAATVLSKAAMALLVIPLAVVALALLTSFVMILLLGSVVALHGTNLLPELLSSSRFWLTPLLVLSLLPVYAFWALPTVGWMLLVSSWARSKIFVWAVVAPVVAVMMVAWTNVLFGLGIDLRWLAGTVFRRLFGSVMPGTWFFDDRLVAGVRHASRTGNGHDAAGMFDVFYSQSWAAFGTANLWIGAIAGVAMIAAAIYLRRRREEG